MATAAQCLIARIGKTEPARGAMAMAIGEAAAQAPQPKRMVQVFGAEGSSFHVNASLVAGATDAVLLNTGFTRADAHRIAAGARPARCAHGTRR